MLRRDQNKVTVTPVVEGGTGGAEDESAVAVALTFGI